MVLPPDFTSLLEALEYLDLGSFGAKPRGLGAWAMCRDQGEPRLLHEQNLQQPSSFSIRKSHEFASYRRLVKTPLAERHILSRAMPPWNTPLLTPEAAPPTTPHLADLD